jgi:hypothetical protein
MNILWILGAVGAIASHYGSGQLTKCLGYWALWRSQSGFNFVIILIFNSPKNSRLKIQYCTNIHLTILSFYLFSMDIFNKFFLLVFLQKDTYCASLVLFLYSNIMLCFFFFFTNYPKIVILTQKKVQYLSILLRGRTPFSYICQLLPSGSNSCQIS